MTTIYFTKLFIAGPLKGLTYNDKISGPNAEQLAKFWHVGRVVKKPIGGSPYKIVDASFQNYAR